MSTQSHLQSYNVTMEDARVFIINTFTNIELIYNVCLDMSITNDMIAEIFANDIPGVTGDDIHSFFEANGFDASALDPLISAHDNKGNIKGLLTSGDTTDDNFITLSGRCEEGSIIKVYNGTTFLGEADITGTSWNYDVNIKDGITYQFNITQVDKLGNESDPSENFILTGDTIAPKISNVNITSENNYDITKAKAGDTVNITFSTDGTNRGLPIVMIMGNNAQVLEASNVSEYIASYTMDTNPADTDGIVTFEINTVDAAGNTEIVTETTDNSYIIYDETIPTVNIVSKEIEVADGDISYYFTFSEGVTGFSTDDITVTNGTKGEFKAISPLIHKLVVTPNSNFEGTVIVEVNENSILDSVGNGNEISQKTQYVDTMSEVEVSSFHRTSSPYKSIGLIVSEFSDGYMVSGTASVVGFNDILTALHLVYKPEHGGWADSLRFYFGVDYNNSTNMIEDRDYYYYSPSKWEAYGLTDNSRYYVDSYGRYEVQYDIALIGVKDLIAKEVGLLSIDPGYNDGTVYAEAVGYPSGSKGMMSDHINVEAHPYYDIYESNYKIFGPGASGGPLLVDDNIIGITSAGTSNSTIWADISSIYDELRLEMLHNNYLIA